MVQRAIVRRSRPSARIEVQHFESAFPFTFLALAFGLVAGVGLTGVVTPEVIHTVVRVVVRIVTGI